jgi:hypothetical protein
LPGNPANHLRHGAGADVDADADANERCNIKGGRVLARKLGMKDVERALKQSKVGFRVRERLEGKRVNSNVAGICDLTCWLKVVGCKITKLLVMPNVRLQTGSHFIYTNHPD